ncbi:MAG: hypothetical protein UX01_C0016G0001, partial [Candidatus Collierbacteria bacterium GW2011_GWB2_45_17]
QGIRTGRCGWITSFLGVKVFTRPDDNIATLLVDECLKQIYLTLATLETTINGCGRIMMRPYRSGRHEAYPYTGLMNQTPTGMRTK